MASSKTIVLHFRLHLTNDLEDGHYPVIPAIRATSGLWKVQERQRAQLLIENEETRYWQLSMNIPFRSQFEWRWAIYNGENAIVDIERDIRRCQVGRFGGVLHTRWDIEAKVLDPRICVVDISTHYKTLADERLAIIGSSDQLGNWLSADAILAYEHPMNSGYWSTSVAVEKDFYQEWKWIIMDKNYDYVRRWESRSNRGLNCESYSWKTIRAPWDDGDYVQNCGYWNTIGPNYVDWSATRLPESLDTCENELCAEQKRKINLKKANGQC